MCYSNPSPTFQPAMRIIQSITKANPAVITTTFDHDYITGEIVRLGIPSGFGMVQADQKTGTITVTSSTTFSIDIDTTSYDAFVDPGGDQCAQVIPIGEVNSILRAAVKNVLPSGDR